MTELKRLEISGIRSFKESPDDIATQSIDFDGPVTLITGDNGTGKTTIIESLKFATMGKCSEEMVSDPNIWGKDSIESRVSLLFKSANQNTYQITLTPSIKKTVKNKKEISFKKGDCEVITTTPEGHAKRSVIPSKDIENQVPNFFGVSPAIIENVIFCHQKDSCWPIDCSTRELKEKFDQIFGAEKYNGAIKALKATLKNLKEEYHAQNAEVSKQNVRQEALLKSEMKIFKIKEEIVKYSDDIDDIQMEFDQVDSQVNDYNKIIPKIEDINREIQNLSGELKSEKNNRNILKIKIKNTRSKEECQSKLGSITSLIDSKKEEQESKTDLLKKSRAAQESLRNEINDLKNEYDKLSENLDSAKSQQNFYYQKMRQFKEIYGSENLDETLDMKRTALAQADEDFKNLDEEQINLKSKEIRENENNLTSQRSQLETLKSGLDSFDSQLSRVADIDEDKIKELQTQIKDTQNQLEAFLKSDKNPDTLEVLIKEKILQKNELEPQKQALRNQKERCKQNADNYNELKNIDEQIKNAHERIDYHLKIIRNGLNDETINCQEAKIIFDQKCSNVKNHIDKLKASRSDLNDNLITISANLQREKTDFEKQEQAANKAKEKFESVLSGQSYKSECEFAEKSLNEINDKLSRLNNSENVYTDFKKKAEALNSNNHHSCPLCEREFASDEDYLEFKRVHLDEFISSLPDQIRKAQFDRKLYENQIKELKKIENDVKIYEEFQAKIEGWIEKIKSLKAEEVNLSMKLNKIDEEIKTNEDIFDNYQQLKVNIDNLKQAMSEEKKFSDKKVGILSTIDESLPRIEEIEDKIEKIEETITNLSNEITDLCKNQVQFNNEKNELSDSIKSLTQECENSEKSLESKKSLDEKVNKQKQKILDIESNIEKLEKNLKVLNEEYEALKLNYDKVKEEKTNNRFNALNEYNSCNDLIQTIKQSMETLKQLESGEMVEYHSKLKLDLKKKEEENKQLSADIGKYNDECVDLNKEILRLKEEEEELNRLDSYYKIVENCDKLQERLNKLEEDKTRKLGSFAGVNIDEMFQKHNELNQKLTEANTNKVNSEEKLREEQEFSNGYESSRKLLSEATIRLKSLELAQNDIDRYIKQLDKTILEYHSQKMDQINDTIQFLWSNTYFGQDIDSIYIRCEEEKAKNAQYNYRVVMKRNGIELDMDRRCSAGQKMLASLIIRLALAQTFALNCGIIALDEPTTNLDEPNMKNLATQLIDLVNSQDSFSNEKKPFQLIIITHNREFVQSLVEEGKIDCFYQITRSIDDSRHCSQIRKCYETNLVLGH